ncbi:MAG: carbamoyltransferase, partial [Candidatus Methylomirabilis sp.]|nr:carbamoyltransferase [Deltaproteobacteria bacterium]
GLAFERHENIEEKVAAAIHAGKVVARFDGRMEYGPRALGNRSMLYHCGDRAVNDWLNKKLRRTEFMPFAPACAYEAKDRLFKGVAGAEHAAEFMTVTFDATDEMAERGPAAVHVDGTARPQLVREEANPSFHRIISEYEKLSGFPCVINTSFNMHEEPIVCTPEDGVKGFVDSRVDFLAMGKFLARIG